MGRMRGIMKKCISVFISVLLLLGLLPVMSFAMPDQNPQNIKVKLNGNQLVFDVPPVVVQDRTMVPLRVIFEALGAKVNWDDSTKTVSANTDKIKIKLIIDKNTAYLNNKLNFLT